MIIPGCGTFIADASCGSVELPAVSQPRNYSIENPIYPLDDPSVWGEGALSSSGKRVSPTKALHLPAVYQAVTRISSDVARCPLELYDEIDGRFTALKADPLYRLTAIQPNREMDAFKFWQRVMVHRLIWSNAYIYIAMNALGQPAELLPLLPDRTEPCRKNGVLVFKTEVDGQEHDIPASRIIHIEGIGFDNMKALELCKLMRDAWGLALSQMDFAARVFRSGGRRGGVLEIPGGMPKGAGDKFEEGFRRKYENAGDWFTTIICRDGTKFHEAQMTLQESQTTEGREESARDAARAFNIRPGHVGVETSGVYGNKSDDTRDYLDMTLRPHMTGIDSQCRIKLLPLPRQATQCFGHNTDDLLQMSVKEQFIAYGAGVTNRIITSNEARGKLGFPPHPDGNDLQNPNTQSPRGGNPDDVVDVAPGKKPAKKTQPQDKGDDALYLALGNAAHKQLAAIVAVIGEKADRAAASGAKFIEWLDKKFPDERAKMGRAIAPLVGCMALHRGEEPYDVASDVFQELQDALEAIASTKSEAELRPAITEYFQNWRTDSCSLDKKQQQAA